VALQAPWRTDLLVRWLATLKHLGRHAEGARLAETETLSSAHSPDFHFAVGDLMLDWTTSAPAASSTNSAAANSSATNSSATTSSAAVAKPKKLSFKEQRELEQLPQLIADLEAEQTSISARLADASLYRQSPSEAQQLNQRYAEIDTLLVQALERWEEIESRSQAS
jgi:hypothetical protein